MVIDAIPSHSEFPIVIENGDFAWASERDIQREKEEKAKEEAKKAKLKKKEDKKKKKSKTESEQPKNDAIQMKSLDSDTEESKGNTDWKL